MATGLLSPQFVRFLVAGGIAAVVNVASRFVYDMWTTYSVAIVLAYLTGMITAYVLTRRYVFTRATRSTSESAPRFVVVNLFGIAQTWAVSVVLSAYVLPALGVTRFAHGIAHIAGVVVPVFTSYVGHRLWTFRDTQAASAAVHRDETLT